MAWLAPLDTAQVKVSAWDAWQASGQSGVPAAVRLNSVAGRPAYHFKADGRWSSVWADTGVALQVTESMVEISAGSAARGTRTLGVEVVDLNQWSF